METRLESVRRILDAATGDGAPSHQGSGRFWNLPLDEFLAVSVYGEQVIVVGRPDDSALIKSLKGAPPFDGSSFPRMPIGRPPVSDSDIQFIAQWIADGCPDSDSRAKQRRPDSAANAIIELMKVPACDHDMSWLADSLRAALKLEFATIPPYLCAQWSVVDAMDPVSLSIREIVREEMLHMGLVCNMLNAIGQTPELNTVASIPSYPGPLPGGVHPGLIVGLKRLTRETVGTFMEVEYPQGGPVARAVDDQQQYPTIGAFYHAILTAFEELNPILSIDRQLEGPLGLTKLGSMTNVRSALALICRQGEGSTASPEDTGPTDLAHYYRFGEIYHGRKLVLDPSTGEWQFGGPDVPFPQVWPMAEVPVGGYNQAVVSGQVWQLLSQFDQTFTLMLDKLQSAWAIGSQTSLGESIGIMFSLRSPAVQLMQMPLPTGGGNYGPCFRIRRN